MSEETDQKSERTQTQSIDAGNRQFDPQPARAPNAPYLIKRNSGPKTPFIFAAPHSGRHYPTTFVEQSQLSADMLRISEDAWVDKLFEHAPQFGGTQIIATYGRSYVDLNRASDELDPAMFSPMLDKNMVRESHRVRAGLGVIPELVAPGQKIYNSPLPAREAEKRINDVYHGYHNALRNLISERKTTFGQAILIDCHSMPSVTDPNERSAEKNHADSGDKKGKAARLISGLTKKKSRSHDADIVLGDVWGSSCDSMLTALAEKLLINEGFKVVRNIPYAGGYATQHYGKPKKGVHAIQIELNRALYMDEITLEPLPQFHAIQRKLSRFAANLMSEFGKTVRVAAE
ncbi:N-formylglutamate amidohydrolase [Kordiimonas sp. SCSIO 12610]|uniref:N-formylglutamate amidohydrolase n=1 Tax=Kordiimonas sp. SCSIO 12610 TaxID=2829597 RepID=UPI00210964C4|nr:N-formylglutamate amidohydrolase [Kordiimonas sp. SCSIO 12610]UTW56044.1 N-formylglutamate amidohydrolase [Kordiimonas sp. SCSIO 12610]